jgi:hypothetical protein
MRPSIPHLGQAIVLSERRTAKDQRMEHCEKDRRCGPDRDRYPRHVIAPPSLATVKNGDAGKNEVSATNRSPAVCACPDGALQNPEVGKEPKNRDHPIRWLLPLPALSVPCVSPCSVASPFPLPPLSRADEE